MVNWLLGEELSVYYFLSDLGLKVEIWGSWLARFCIDKIGDNVDFCSIELAINEPGRINVGSTINLI